MPGDMCRQQCGGTINRFCVPWNVRPYRPHGVPTRSGVVGVVGELVWGMNDLDSLALEYIWDCHPCFVPFSFLFSLSASSGDLSRP